MSLKPTDEAGLAAEPDPVPPESPMPLMDAPQVVEEARPERRARRESPRYTRLMIRKVGPWSVLKFSLLFYFCIMLVVFLALAILYGIMGASGVLDSAAHLLASVGFGDGKTFEFNGGWIFWRVFLIGVGMVVIWSFINLFAAFLYNLVSDVVGGIEVTLSERR